MSLHATLALCALIAFMFDAISYINEPRWQKVSLGLRRIEALLKLLSNPQDSLRFIHVAGTNGKGSTCAFLESIFRCAGFKTGLFTSPYIQTFTDRIRVNNNNISDNKLVDITLRVKDKALEVEKVLGEHPTEFELITAIAFCHFAEQNCDVVILEVGLGGRLDSTNVITPEVSAITKIGFDHVKILGDTIEKIAYEKAGIIKQGVPVVSALQDQRVNSVIKKVAKENNSEFFVADEADVRDLNLKMKGDFQFQNAAVAKKVAEVYFQRHSEIDFCAIKTGIENATWPGRFEIFDKDLPAGVELVIVDGAHNVDGAKALKGALNSDKNVKGKNIIGVFGALNDKDVKGVLRVMSSVLLKIVLYSPNSQRAMKEEQLYKLATANLSRDSVYVAKSPALALKIGFEEASDLAMKKGSQTVIVCFGSLYSVGKIRSCLIG